MSRLVCSPPSLPPSLVPPSRPSLPPSLTASLVPPWCLPALLPVSVAMSITVWGFRCLAAYATPSPSTSLFAIMTHNRSRHGRSGLTDFTNRNTIITIMSTPPTYRPSASVLLISTVLPEYITCTSSGRAERLSCR